MYTARPDGVRVSWTIGNDGVTSALCRLVGMCGNATERERDVACLIVASERVGGCLVGGHRLAFFPCSPKRLFTQKNPHPVQ
jgi:hypothetical protein